MKVIEDYQACEGLPEDLDVRAVAVDRTGGEESNPQSVVRLSVPKAIVVDDEQPHFEVYFQ